MKKLFLPLAAILLLAGPASFAQDRATRKAEKRAQKQAEAAQQKAQDVQDEAQKNAEDAQQSAKEAQDDADDAQDQVNIAVQNAMNNINILKDFDEIVIKRKNSDKDDKVTIEIKGDSVFVNGQPIEDFTNDQLSVKIQKPMRFNLIAPSSPFHSPRSEWSFEDGNMFNGGNFLHQPFLGVLTEASDGGAKITNITENSAAAKAGLQKDDIITKVNDKPVADHKQLTEIITGLKPKDKVDITYKRNGKESKTTAILGERNIVTTYRRHFGPGERPERPEIPEMPEAPEAPEFGAIPPIPPMHFNFDGDRFGFTGKPRIGIKAQDTEDGKGVKVLDVDDDSPAEKSGLKKDDIITSFDGKNVNSATELAEASHASKDKPSVKVQVKRNGKTENIELKVPKKLKTANL